MTPSISRQQPRHLQDGAHPQVVQEGQGGSRPAADHMTALVGDTDDESGDIDAVVYSR